MILEPGATVWCMDGPRPREPLKPFSVWKGEVKSVSKQGFFIATNWRSYKIGETAYFESSKAYGSALAVESNALASIGLVSAEHIEAWNKLMTAWTPDITMHQGWSIKNFAAWEFLCPDCKEERMNRRFMMRLMLSRGIAGIPYVIGSGWRCPVRNAAVGGVEDSSHMTGLAADIIATTSQERFIIVNACLRAGFRRIGITRYYIHVDTDPTKVQDIIYLYEEKEAA